MHMRFSLLLIKEKIFFFSIYTFISLVLLEHLQCPEHCASYHCEPACIALYQVLHQMLS